MASPEALEPVNVQGPPKMLDGTEDKDRTRCRISRAGQFASPASQHRRCGLAEDQESVAIVLYPERVPSSTDSTGRTEFVKHARSIPPDFPEEP